MSTIVGILAITSMINTTSESLKVRKILFCCILVFVRSWIFVVIWVEHEKSFYNTGAQNEKYVKTIKCDGRFQK